MQRTLLMVLFLTELVFVSASRTISVDDTRFWNRFLRDGSSFSLAPTQLPTKRPSPSPTPSPSGEPSSEPTKIPTIQPTLEPTLEPTPIPSPGPTLAPSPGPTLAPSPGPTLAPSLGPTLAPSPGPTPAPSPDPTQNPTSVPTSNPTFVPTNSPSPEPTSGPTLVPTAQPTLQPQQECFVDVELDCTTSEGISCTEIVPPMSTSCTTGSELSVVTFSFQGSTCDPTSNNQGDEALCEDVSDLNFPSVKQIECREQQGGLMVVEPSTIEPGQSFTVSSPDNGALPEKIECTLLDGQTPVQINVIDTSGNVDLQLGDRFGALQLETCDDITCREVVCYVIEIQNVGTVSLDISKVEFTLEDETANLLEQVEDSSLDPGQFTSLEPCVEIGICGGNEYSAFVDVEASPPRGDLCQANDEFSFQISQLPPTTPQVPAPVMIPVPSPTALPVPAETSAPIQTPAPVSSGQSLPPALETALPEPPIPTPPPVPLASPTSTLPAPVGSKKNKKGKGQSSLAPAQAPAVASKKRGTSSTPMIVPTNP